MVENLVSDLSFLNAITRENSFIRTLEFNCNSQYDTIRYPLITGTLE